MYLASNFNQDFKFFRSKFNPDIHYPELFNANLVQYIPHPNCLNLNLNLRYSPSLTPLNIHPGPAHPELLHTDVNPDIPIP